MWELRKREIKLAKPLPRDFALLFDPNPRSRGRWGSGDKSLDGKLRPEGLCWRARAVQF